MQGTVTAVLNVVIGTRWKENSSKVDGMNVTCVAFVAPHSLSSKHVEASDTATAVWKATTNNVPSVFSLCFSHSPSHSIVDL